MPLALANPVSCCRSGSSANNAWKGRSLGTRALRKNSDIPLLPRTYTAGHEWRFICWLCAAGGHIPNSRRRGLWSAFACADHQFCAQVIDSERMICKPLPQPQSSFGSLQLAPWIDVLSPKLHITLGYRHSSAPTPGPSLTPTPGPSPIPTPVPSAVEISDKPTPFGIDSSPAATTHPFVLGIAAAVVFCVVGSLQL